MPIKWENDILGFVPKSDWVNLPFQVERPNDPVSALFDNRKTDNLMAEWESMAAEYTIPVMAQFHAFDTEARIATRVPIDQHSIEKGLIKEKLNTSERLDALIGKGVTNDSALYDYVVNDALRLGEAVITRAYVANNELLATGKVTIKENGLNLTVDYGVPSNHLNKQIDMEEDVLEQLDNIREDAAKIGVKFNGMVLSNRIMQKFRRNTGLQIAINGVASSGVYLSDSAIQNFLSTNYGINEFRINDERYGVKREINKTTKRPVTTTARYFPDDQITFYSTQFNGKLAGALWGNPPENRLKQHRVTTSQASQYVTITQWEEVDPAVLWTKASTIFMPVLFSPDSLWVAKIIN